ncbi:MAG: cache domain-containing protein [Acidobacteria bacterium]|nr:cache domain-containing protein [Acidobacteriota bacterium]
MMGKAGKLSARILIAGLLSAPIFCGGLGWVFWSIRSAIYESQSARTAELVETAWKVLEYYGGRAADGSMTTEQAQEAAKQTIKHLRYKNNYFWINDLNPRMVMHPTNPALDGKDLNDYRDPDGVALFVKMVEVCKARDAGLVEYRWPKPGGGDPLQKISYVRMYRPWGWIVGSGLYLEDVEGRLGSLPRIFFTSALAGILMLAAIVIFLARSVTAPIRTIALGLRKGASAIGDVAGQVASSSRIAADEANHQVASIQEASSAGEEITAMARRTADHAGVVAQRMTESDRMVHEANGRLKEMVESMGAISAAGQSISRIISVIDEIAFQTNILALNAAVEAARAGDAGAGFAVVADEVRNLAQRCAQAAKDTSTMIRDSIEKSEHGNAKLLEMEHAITGVTAKVREVRALADEVSEGSQQQTLGVERVARVLTDLEQGTHRTASSAAQGASAGKSMESQAEAVLDAVRQLEMLV